MWWKNFVCFFPLFFLQFFFISLCCNFFFFFVTVGFCRSFFFCFVFYKTLAFKDSNTIQTETTNPHPWGPSRAGDSGDSPWLFVWLFSLSLPGRLAPVGRCGVLGQVEFIRITWGDGHEKGYPNKITTNLGCPQRWWMTLRKGAGTQWRRDRWAQAGLSYPWRLCAGGAGGPCLQVAVIILCSRVAPSESSCLHPQVR